jgi:hypothetical protein
MAFARAVVVLLAFGAAGCASAPPETEGPAAKLIAASPPNVEPLRPAEDLLDATAAADKIAGGMLEYARVRGLEVEPLRATLERFRKDLVQHLRRETITSVWLDVPGQDGFAWERFEITLVYSHGLTGYRVNDRAFANLAGLPKLPPGMRRTEVWYRAREEKAWTPARTIKPGAQKIALGRMFDAGRISGNAQAWVTVEVVQN